MSTGKIVLGTLAGLAIGAVLGVLFAPEKGSVTRKKIMDTSDDIVDEFKSKYDEFCDAVNEKFENTKHQVDETVSKGRSIYEDVKKEATNMASDFKKSNL